MADNSRGRGASALRDLVGLSDNRFQPGQEISTLVDPIGLIEPTEDQLRLSDLNRDGSITVVDAIMSLQSAVGLIELTECGPPVP